MTGAVVRDEAEEEINGPQETLHLLLDPSQPLAGHLLSWNPCLSSDCEPGDGPHLLDKRPKVKLRMNILKRFI